MIVEDSRELRRTIPHVVRLEARPRQRRTGRSGHLDRPGPAVAADAAGPAGGRRGPGREICDLLTALNTGHEGGCGTVHANSAADVPARLEALAALGGLDRSALHAQLTSALACGGARHPGRGGVRRVSEISVLVRDPATGLVHTERAVLFTADGRVERARAGQSWNGCSADDDVLCLVCAALAVWWGVPPPGPARPDGRRSGRAAGGPLSRRVASMVEVGWLVDAWGGRLGAGGRGRIAA